ATRAARAVVRAAVRGDAARDDVEPGERDHLDRAAHARLRVRGAALAEEVRPVDRDAARAARDSQRERPGLGPARELAPRAARRDVPERAALAAEPARHVRAA